MKPLRVLQVLTIMNRGGAETMIMNYYRNMDRTKVQFDFLLHRHEEGVFDEEIKQLGGQIHRLSKISLITLGHYQKELDGFFKSHPEYDVIHSHLNALSVFVLKAAKQNNVPVRIAHSHTSLYHINLNPFSKNKSSINFILKFFAQNYFKRNVPKYANYYFTCGEKAGVWLFGKQNKTKIKTVNNAIETDQLIYDKIEALNTKSDLHVKDKFVIGHVGNFVPEKNHAFLLDVFKSIMELHKNSILLLVGGGDRSKFEALAHDMGISANVKFLGVRNDVPKILQAIDVFVFPSTNEGIPVTLIESQATGLKIFASDAISKELNITGLIDFISLDKSPNHWAKEIIKYISYNRQNKKNDIVEGNYDIKNNALALQKFYYNNAK